MAGQGTIEEVSSCLDYAQDIAKRIKEARYDMDKTDLKYLLADMTSAIASAKVELNQLQSVCEMRDVELVRMNEVLIYKGNLRRRGDGYYKTLDDGRQYGQPYCSYCWEGEHKMFHLHNRVLSKDVRICPSCKNEYQSIRTPYLETNTTN